MSANRFSLKLEVLVACGLMRVASRLSSCKPPAGLRSCILMMTIDNGGRRQTPACALTDSSHALLTAAIAVSGSKSCCACMSQCLRGGCACIRANTPAAEIAGHITPNVDVFSHSFDCPRWQRQLCKVSTSHKTSCYKVWLSES